MNKRLELTVPPCIESSYLLATLCAFIGNFMILCPTEVSHYELHRKLHKTVTDNSAIAVSFVYSTARKGGV